MIRVDIPMPRSCIECPFYADEELIVSGLADAYCKAFYKDAAFDDIGKRQTWCPLSEVDKPKDDREEYIKLSDIEKFPIRKNHYDRENGNIHFISGIETVMEYIDTLDRYR